jgi:tetratricopeptide (TPR) repeat protein
MIRTRPAIILGAAGLVFLVGGLALGEDLLERVQRLRAETHYDLAEELLEDHLDRGAPLSPELEWVRAQLSKDPDRFDRLAAELTSGRSAEDPRTQEIVLARAREYFARGRYLSAVELLQALPAGDSEVLAEAALFHGMAAAAAGSAREARERFLLVPPGSSRHAMAQTLLANLSLRTGEPQSALQYAESALASGNRDIAAQALYARARALEEQGESERAERTYEEILRNHGHCAEAAWIREARLQAARQAATEITGVPEEEAPVSRRGFALQLGAFHDRSLALRLAGALENEVEALRIERDATTSPPWYRVVGGRFTTRTAAESERSRLAGKGWDCVILAPGRG